MFSPAAGRSGSRYQFGDEGDLAFDDANHLYFVDTNVADNTIAHWSVTGSGLTNMKLDFTRPLVPTVQPVDDRPWVTAHGDGHVFYLGNEGDKVTYPLGQGTGSGSGAGRYTVYRSTDGGQTFDPLGYTLKDPAGAGRLLTTPPAPRTSTSSAATTAARTTCSPRTTRRERSTPTSSRTTASASSAT